MQDTVGFAFKYVLSTIKEMQQPVHLRELVSAARHVQRNGMKHKEFVQFAADSLNKTDSKCQGMGSSFALTKNL